jgi:hypothetical protein
MANLYDDEELRRYLQMMQASPEETSRANAEGLMAMGLGMLANPQKGRELEAIAQGGLLGLNTRRASLDDAVKVRGQNIAQAAGLRKMARQDQFVNSLTGAPGGAAGAPPEPGGTGVAGAAPGAAKGPLDQLLDMGIPMLAIQTALSEDNPQAAIQKLITEYDKPHFGQGVIPLKRTRTGYEAVQPAGLPEAIGAAEAAKRGGEKIEVPWPTPGNPGATRLMTYAEWEAFKRGQQPQPAPNVPAAAPAAASPAPSGPLVGGMPPGAQIRQVSGVPYVADANGVGMKDEAFARSVGVEPQPLPAGPAPAPQSFGGSGPLQPGVSAPQSAKALENEQQIRMQSQMDANKDALEKVIRPTLDAESVAKKFLVKLDTLDKLLVNGATGWTAPLKQGASSLLSGLGMAPDGVKAAAAEYEVFRSAVLEQAMITLRQDPGVKTEGDAQRAQDIWINIRNRPESNAYLRDVTRASSNLAIEKAKFFRKALGNPKYSGKYDAIERDWAEVAPSLWGDPAMAKWVNGVSQAPTPNATPGRAAAGTIGTANVRGNAIDDIVRKYRGAH